MSDSVFHFKQFFIHQDKCAMKVGTDAVLLGAWVTPNGSNHILDIGTGTGVIALMLAQKTNSPIDAIEIDPDAFGQAKENISGSPWKDRVTIYQADAAQFAFSSKYDILVSNPPFYENELK